jgi:hypothetical protein
LDCQTAVNVDQLKAWNVNLLQRMMSDQRHRRNSMNNTNTNARNNMNANASLNASLTQHSSSSHGVYRNTSNNNSNSNNNNNNNNAMSLHSLLVAPHTEMLSLSKRAPDFSTSLPTTASVGVGAGAGAVDGSSTISSVSVGSNDDMPYQPFLRRDSLCGFKQL